MVVLTTPCIVFQEAFARAFTQEEAILSVLVPNLTLAFLIFLNEGCVVCQVAIIRSVNL